ncbi:hypothetical protein RYX36_012335, partial [Vicia faba]
FSSDDICYLKHIIFHFHFFILTGCGCLIWDCASQILVYKSLFVLIQNGHPLEAELQLASGIVP